ncbi:MAG: GDP-mannose 4,6-dehydratase, partial [Candidatus Omnitrophota bacterium]
LRLIKTVRPDRIFHLAGQASVMLSWRDPAATMTANLVSTQHVFDAVRQLVPKARIHIASSSDEYGRCPYSHMPIREIEPLRPITPYAVSKVAQEVLAMQQHAVYGTHVVRTRAFNHLGPGQTEFYVASSFARQVALIERGRQPNIIEVGNVSAIRDFTDVRDVVRAYWLALEHGKPGQVYNICSGVGRPVSELLTVLRQKSSRQIQIRRDPSKLRARDIARFVGSPLKFRRLTGWRQRISFERSVEDLLADWRRRLERSS